MVRLLEAGHLEEDIQSKYFWKRKILNFFCRFKYATVENLGCLPLARANHSVHGVGKWFAKFRTGKFRPEIAFTICTNQFHLPENDSEGLKTGIKDGFEKMDHEFPFGIFHPEK